MKTVEISIVIECSTEAEIADDLREIADRIDEGYVGGITNSCGTSWGLNTL